MRPSLLALAVLAPLSAGCTAYETVDVDGTTREFLIHVPDAEALGGAPAEGWPLVIAFHGAYSTPSATEDYTGLSALADEEGFVVVYPKGKQRLWNDGRIPDLADDVAFTAALIDHLVAEYEVDPERVFATGISNGGFMAHRVGCELADRVVGIAPVAGTLSEELVEICDPVRPVGVMLFMGTDDDLVPYDGGALGGGLGAGAFGTMLSAPQTTDHWADLDGCAGAPEITELDALDDGTRIETRHYAGCEGRGQVVLHTIEGGGHTWPGAGYVAGLGVASQELDASETMWRFFAALP